MPEEFQVPSGTLVLETMVDFDGLNEGLEEFRKKGEEAGEDVGEAVGEGARKGGQRAEELAGKLESAKKSAEKAGEGARDAGEGFGDFADTAEGAAEASAGLALVVGRRLVSGLRGAVGWLGRTTSGLLGVTSVGLETAGQGLRELGQELKENGGAWRALGIAADGAGRTLQGVGVVLGKVAASITGVQVAAIAAAAALAHMGNRATDKFVPGWNRVLTLIPEGTEGLEELRDRVDALSASLGVAEGEALAAFYNVLSALPQLAQRPTEALKVLEAVLKATSTGFADGATAARAITSVMNAFGLEAEEALRVADQLFAAQNQGVLTFGEVAAEIGKVSDLTSSLNADFGDLLGILATVTPSGQNVSQTMTQISSVLGEILDPTEELNEALGGSAAGFVRDRGLVAALQRVAEVTEGNPEVIARMFGRKEAIALVVSLSRQLDTLEQKTRDIAEAGGETDRVVQRMNRSFEKQKDILDKQVNRTLRQLSDTWQGLRVTAVGALAAILQGINDVDDAVDHSLDNLILGLLAHPLSPVQSAAFTQRLSLNEELRKAAQRAGEAPDLVPGAGGRGGGGFLSIGLAEAEAARRQLEEATRLLGEIRTTAGEIPRVEPIEEESIRRMATFVGFRDALREMAELTGPVVGPGVEGFEAGPGGQLVAADEDVRRLASLAREMERINRVAETEEQRLRLAQKALDEHGLSVDDVKNSTSELADIILRELLRALPAWAEEMLGLTDETDDAADSTRDLVDHVENLVQLAGGVLALADAFGVFGDEAERELNRAVRSATQLVQGIQSLQSAIAQGASGLSLLGPIGAIAGGAAGLISGVAGLFGPSAEEQRAREEVQRQAFQLAETLRELERSAEAVRSVFETLSGGEIEQFREVFERLPDDLGGGELFSELFEILGDMGLTFADLKELAEAFNIELDHMQRFFEGERGPGMAEGIADEIEALERALQAAELERAFETFQGKMELLQQEFELFDIEDPLEQLRRIREELLAFGDLPPELAAALQEANLATEEGRAQLEATIQDLFTRLQEGQLSPEDLGDLTLPEFLDLLRKLEGTLDELAGGGGFDLGRALSDLRQEISILDLSQEDAFNRMVAILEERTGVSGLAELLRTQPGQAQSLIAELFRKARAAEPGAELFGELTKEEFLELLDRIERAQDAMEGAAEAGEDVGDRVVGFQEVNRATAVQAGQLVSFASANLELDRVRNELLRRLTAGSTPALPSVVAPRAVQTDAGGVSVRVDAPQITVSGVEAPEEAAREVAGALERRLLQGIDRALGDRVAAREKARGSPNTVRR